MRDNYDFIKDVQKATASEVVYLWSHSSVRRLWQEEINNNSLTSSSNHNKTIKICLNLVNFYYFVSIRHFSDCFKSCLKISKKANEITVLHKQTQAEYTSGMTVYFYKWIQWDKQQNLWLIFAAYPLIDSQHSYHFLS